MFEVRYLSVPLPVKTIIHDRVEVNMCIANPLDNDLPSLWSNNPQFVKVMVTYFEDLWTRTQAILEPLATQSIKPKQPQT